MTSSRDLDLGSDRDIDQQAQILLVGNELLRVGNRPITLSGYRGNPDNSEIL
jgi:hypothetical protein